MPALKIETLKVDRFLGVGRERSPVVFKPDDICGGVNVVYGPNGSGKTTTAKALACLFWPDLYANQRPTLSGEFSDGATTWRTDIDAGHARHTPAAPTALPSSDKWDRYYLPLHELLNQRSGDTRLAEEIQKEIYGGINLTSAEKRLDFSGSVPGRGIRERTSVNEAMKQERAARERQERCRERAGSLGELGEQHQRARGAQQRAELLQAVIAYRQAEFERETRHQALADMVEAVPGIDRYSRVGDKGDLDTFLELHKGLGEKRRGLRNAQEAERVAREACEKTGFGEAPPGDRQLDDWRGVARQLHELGGEIKRCAEAVKTAEESRKDVLRQIEERNTETDVLAASTADGEPAPAPKELGALSDWRAQLAQVEKDMAAFQREQARAAKVADQHGQAYAKAVAEVSGTDAGETRKPPPVAEFARLRNAADSFQEIEHRVAEADQRVEQAKALRDRERTLIGEALTDDQLVSLDRVGMDAFDGFLDMAARVEGGRRALERMSQWSQGEDAATDANTDALRRAVIALEDWLAQPSPGVPNPRMRWLVFSAAGLLAVLVVVLAFVAHPAYSVLLAIPAAVASLALRWSAVDPTDRRLQLAERYVADGLPEEPAEWTPAAVGKSLGELRRRLAAAEFAVRYVETGRPELADECEKLRRRTCEIRNMLGVGDEVAVESLQQLARRICGFQGAESAYQEARTSHASAEQNRSSVLSDINRQLTETGLTACDTAADVRAAIVLLEQIRGAYGEHRTALDELERKTAELTAVAEQRDAVLAKINAALKPLGVPVVSDAATAGAAVEELGRRREHLDETKRRLAELKREVERLTHELARLDAAIADHDAKQRAAEKQHGELVKQLGQTLQAFGEEGVQTATDADACVARVTERLTRFREATEALRTAQRENERLTGEICDDRNSRLAVLLSRLGLDLSDDGDPESSEQHERQLQDLDRQYPLYCDLRMRKEEADFRVNDRGVELRRRRDFDEALLELSEQGLGSQLEDAKHLAESAEDLTKQIEAIKADVRLLSDGHELEVAVVKREQVQAALARKRDETFAANVGHLLVEHLRQRNQAHASPVLNRARELFSSITSGAYEIKVSESDASGFVARDTSTGEIRTLDELSSGTCVQLLVAVRMAFLEVEERGGAQLPLVLDEALGNSDDQRAPELIQAVLSIAREGRQVFYFTARWDEVHKWRQSVETANAGKAESEHVAFAELHLPTDPSTEMRRGPEPLTPPVLVPEPGDCDYEQYAGVLGVPRVDPWSPVRRMHLWYVLDDPQALCSFLARGVTTWGQLSAVLEEAGDDAPMRLGISDAPGLADSARAAAALFEEFLELWKIGRGRPVDRRVLADSPLAKSTHFEDLATLAEDCNGDAKLLVERALGIHRFGKKGQDRLRDHLEDVAYLDPRERLTEVDLRAQLTVRLAGLRSELVAGCLTPERVNELLGRVSM